MSYDNTNTGILRRNARKEKETHPDHTGSINVEGKEYWVSAWIKTAGEGSKIPGQKFFSLALKPKDAPAAPPKAPEQTPAQPDFDDDIPF